MQTLILMETLIIFFSIGREKVQRAHEWLGYPCD
jgi:hypothetical protein